MIEVNCTACGSKLEAPDSAAGRLSKCPYCREAVQIPAAGAVASAESAPARPSETKQEMQAPAAAEKAPAASSKKADSTKVKGKRKFRKNEPKEEPAKDIRVGGKKITTAKKSKNEPKKAKSPYAAGPKKKMNGTVKVFASLAALVVLGVVLLQTQKQTAAVRGADEEQVADASQAVEGEFVSPYDTPEMAAAVDKLNGILTAAQKKAGVEPNPPMDDQLFVRRAYLDIGGSIAPYDKTISYLYDESPDRRKKVIQELIDSEGYTSHTFNYFADIWRIKTVISDELRTDAFIHWLKEQIYNNEPYDKIVYSMMTADGRLWDDPAVGWHLRDNGTKMDHISYFTKSLLGTDISCAQCHNDPHDHWEQKEYWEFAAFLSELRTKAPRGKRGYYPGGKFQKAVLEDEEIRTLAKLDKMPMETEEEREQLRRRANNFVNNYNRQIFKPFQLKVHDQRASLLLLPVNYKYKNGFPRERVKPHVILGDRNKLLPGMTPRQKLAKWVTSPKNPWFARNYANHMWYRMFGRAIVEPLHDADPKAADVPELLDALAEEVVRLNFDMRAVTWLIASTDAYQRAATRELVPVTEPYFFPGPMLRRMSAEQLWDSFVTLSVEDPMRYRANPGLEYHAIINLEEDQKRNDVDPEQVIHRLNALNYYRGQRTVVDSDEVKMLQDLEAQEGSMKAMIGAVSSGNGGGGGGGGMMMSGDAMMSGGGGGSMMMAGMMDGKGGGMSKVQNKPGDQMMMASMGDGRRAKKLILTRASELQQPADFSHLLHKFGQSERNFQVNAVSKEGSVPQVMELMNGYATKFVCSPTSMVNKNIRRTSLASQRASTVFLTILNRRPTDEEKELIGDVGTTREGIADLIWALLNSPEFMFIQ
jgi:uncharacterized membrane protein YgcG